MMKEEDAGETHADYMDGNHANGGVEREMWRVWLG